MLAGSRRIGERAVSIIDERASAAQRACDQRNTGRKVHAVRALGVVSYHVDSYGCVFCCLRARIVPRCRRIVNDAHGEWTRVSIAVGVGNGNRENLGRCIARRVVGEREGIGQGSGCRIIAGNQQDACWHSDNLSGAGYDDTVDLDASYAIGRSEVDRTAGGFAGRFGI